MCWNTGWKNKVGKKNLNTKNPQTTTTAKQHQTNKSKIKQASEILMFTPQKPAEKQNSAIWQQGCFSLISTVLTVQLRHYLRKDKACQYHFTGRKYNYGKPVYQPICTMLLKYLNIQMSRNLWGIFVSSSMELSGCQKMTPGVVSEYEVLIEICISVIFPVSGWVQLSMNLIIVWHFSFNFF